MSGAALTPSKLHVMHHKSSYTQEKKSSWMTWQQRETVCVNALSGSRLCWDLLCVTKQHVVRLHFCTCLFISHKMVINWKLFQHSRFTPSSLVCTYRSPTKKPARSMALLGVMLRMNRLLVAAESLDSRCKGEARSLSFKLRESQ